MTFLTTPLMRSFVGFDNLFDEFERMAEFSDNKYPAYNIIKSGDEEYKIEVAVAGFNEDDINIEVKKGLMTIEASKAKHSNEYLHRGIVGSVRAGKPSVQHNATS